MKRIVIAIIIVVLTGCDFSGYHSKDVGSVIGKEVRNSGTKEIDLAQIVPFTWDELYLFDPYTPASEVCKVLNIPINKCSMVIDDKSMDDGEMYMVFMLIGTIVHKEIYFSLNGEFTNYPKPIKVDKSKFIVAEKGQKTLFGKPWLELVPVG